MQINMQLIYLFTFLLIIGGELSTFLYLNSYVLPHSYKHTCGYKLYSKQVQDANGCSQITSSSARKQIMSCSNLGLCLSGGEWLHGHAVCAFFAIATLFLKGRFSLSSCHKAC
jgi:hypothetical protein